MVTTIRKVTGGDYPFYEFACLSTDTKPTSLVPENSICHEIDTGKHFYFSNGEWKELPPKGGSGGEGLPDNFPAEGSANANKFAGFDENGLWTAKDAPSGGGAEKFVVTLTQDEQTEKWTADKTVAEIVEAYEANQVVVASYPIDGLPIDIPLLLAGTFTGDDKEGHIAFFSLTFEGDHGTLENLVISAQGADEDNWEVEENNYQKLPIGDDDGDMLVWDESDEEWKVGTNPNAPLIVTMTAGETEGQFVGDKTYKEVYDAFVANQSVKLRLEFVMEGKTRVIIVNILGCAWAEEFEGTSKEYVIISTPISSNELINLEGGSNDFVTFTMA